MNMLPSSSGSLDLFGINAQLIQARKFVRDGATFQGFLTVRAAER
jgi:hypothetical protein